jgi:lysophospholipase L1-like esterase
MRSCFPLCLAMVLACPRLSSAQAPAKAPELPRVLLIGDSIRLGYAPLVAKRLQGRAVVLSPADNGGDSGNVLKNLERWAVEQKPDVVHFNCGLHDLKLDKKSKRYQVALEQYEANLRQIVARLRKLDAPLVFASTTPIHDERHAKRGASFDRLEADVGRYNEAARQVMKEAGVPVHDMHWVVKQEGADKLLSGDGTHYTPEGNERLAEAVADCVLRQLSVARYRPLPAPASGSKAAAEYRQAETERDAQVPPAYKNLPIGKFPVPASSEMWKGQRPRILEIVRQSLGDLPPRPTPVRARSITRELRAGYVLERVSIENGVDGEIGALLLLPEGAQQRNPAILWLHSSTPDKTQIITPNTNGGAEPLGEVLVRAGFVVFAPDAYWHGERAGTGPAGPTETGRTEQESLFKLNLWMGRTLWGMFVRDDQIALDYLVSRPEVNPHRIGTTGMSMGSTRAWWLAAVDERIACAVGIACLTRYENLIRHGQLKQHGVYYFANGLLKHFDSEGVLALIAPRPFLALTGALDAGSPADGVMALEEKVSKVYGVLGVPERYRSVLYPEIGHTVTPAMRAETLAWFERWLK